MLSKIRNLFSSSPTSPRAQAELFDATFAIVMSRYRSRRLASADPHEEDSGLLLMAEKQTEEELRGQCLYEHRSVMQKQLQDQASKLMYKIEENTGGDGVLMERELHENVGFSLLSQPSLVHGADKGLYVTGSALAGSVLGFIPGRTCLPEHLKRPGALDEFQDDPNHLILSRYDEVVIDARGEHGLCMNNNPYAMGHFANHPSQGVMPNVIQLMLDYSSDIDPDIEHLIPNQFAKPPTLLGTPDRSACMYGLCLMAARDVKEEELFVNYRFNPAAKASWPTWYAPVEGDGGEERWSKE